MTRVRLAPQARRDVTDAARWISRDDKVAAKAFRDAVAKGARMLAAHPLAGVERPDIADPPVRFLPLARFPYVLVYDPGVPLILRVLHGARDLPEALADGGP